MKSRLYVAAATAILLAASAQAATINTTLTVTNATLSIGAAGYSVSGPITLSGIGTGTINATISLNALSSQNITAPYTITLTGGTLIGTLTVPATILSNGNGVGSATVTGGTGSYAGATGSFPSVSGSGTISGLGGTLSVTGVGTINTSGGGSSTPTPTISAVLDAGSYTAGVAQGSVFVVKGTNLSPSGYTPLSFPLPTSSGGVSIAFTPATGGTATAAYLDYLYNQGGVNQLAAILPSTVAPGNYNVTVTAGGQTSAGFTTQVVARKPGLITGDSTGNGLAVIQNYVSASELDINRFTVGSVGGFTISPAHPGQTEIAYSVGMGPDPGPDNQASPGYNFLANGVAVNAIVGGMSIPAGYAGRVAGGSGYEQINFVLPANVPTGCTVSFQISVNGVLSNPTFISIAPSASANACVQAGFTTSQLQNFDQGGTVYAGSFQITQLSATIPSIGTVKNDQAAGGFTLYSGFELASIPQTSLSNPTQGCVVIFPGQSSGTGGGTGIGLDAGAVTLTGPAGSSLANAAFTELANAYNLNIGTEGLPSGLPGTGGIGGTIVAGTYTLNGAGGTDVGKFSATVKLGSALTVTGGLPSVVNRAAGLTLNWTGGNSTDLVQIIGSSGTSSSTGANSALLSTGASFVCITTAGAGTFTVPASILTQLPPATNATGANQGFLTVYSSVTPSAGNGLFSAPLTAGGTISNATFLGLVGTSSLPAYQ